MAHLINKDALVAEIKSRISNIKVSQNAGLIKKRYAEAKINFLKSILSLIDTIEVKEVQEPTASDRGMAEEIIINLKRVENDYRIDLTREMEWVRNKAQKGE